MNTLIICLCLVLCISGALAIVAVAVKDIIKTIYKAKEQERLMNLDINKLTNDMLFVDGLIQDSVINYRVVNIDHDDKFYMSQQAESRMITEVLKEVLNRISPIVYKKLHILYDNKILEDIIYKKVSVAVLEVKLEVNGSYID